MKTFNAPDADVRAFESWAKDGTVSASYLQEVLGDARSVSTAGTVDVASLIDAPSEGRVSLPPPDHNQ